MQQNILENYVREGMSISEISKITKASLTSVRYWLKKYNLKTSGKAGAKSKHEVYDNHKVCIKCTERKHTDLFRRRKDRNNWSSYCKTCESKSLIDAEKKLKMDAIVYLGSVCNSCSNSYDNRCYDFHHTEPEHKDFNIASNRALSLKKIKPELDKCILLCANCHHVTHKIIKERDGYNNKIKGNTELWNENKKSKLNYMNKNKCDRCNYNKEAGNLCIIFPINLKHYKKYNKTHWDNDFIKALEQASVLCKNCYRLDNKLNYIEIDDEG